ncbi:hypothetical protein D3C75_358820 [compost metagenome]
MSRLLLRVGSDEANQVRAVRSVAIPHAPPDEAVKTRVAAEHIGHQIGPAHGVIDVLITVPLRISTS